MRGKFLVVAAGVLGVMLAALPAAAETCTAGTEMDAATRASIEQSARQFFELASRGDVFTMKQRSIPAVSSNFTGIEQSVIEQKPLYAGAQATTRSSYLLDAQGSQPLERAEFYCGIYNSPNRVAFVIPNLPPGKYAVVTQDITTSKGSYQLTTILQQMGAEWRLAGYYSKPSQWSGHDGNWFLSKAREYAAKGQTHNAYLYYVAAEDLLAPVGIMTTPALEKVYQEHQKVTPPDFPANGPANLTVGAKTYSLTQVFPVPQDNGIVLVVRYRSDNVSNTEQTLNDNMALIKGLVARYPELRDAFVGVVARATEPSGRDYGTLLAMDKVTQ